MAEDKKKEKKAEKAASYFGGMLEGAVKAFSGRKQKLQDAEDAAMGNSRPPQSEKWKE